MGGAGANGCGKTEDRFLPRGEMTAAAIRGNHKPFHKKSLLFKRKTMKPFFRPAVLFVTCIILLANGYGQTPKTYTNPLISSGADPWCIFKNGYYYYTNTTGHNITIWKTKSIADLKSAASRAVYNPPPHGPHSKELWAPEIHFVDSSWYIYFAADSGNNIDHRLWVLENRSADPFTGEWTMKGKLTTPGDKWSIDGSLFELRGQRYFIWSGWEGDVNGQQNIYIAKMKNPWTIEGPRVMLSRPELPWETYGPLNGPNDPPNIGVNEGPEVLRNGNKMFLVYSASGCWTDFYALGMLTAPVDADPMDPAAWKKSSKPVFTQSIENGVYAPGHNSFFKSPDGKQDYILYHANSQPGQGCGRFRSPRAQLFTWNKDGTPNFGSPVKEGVVLSIPTGGHD
jgi:GH43 family beta-xylosidase